MWKPVVAATAALALVGSTLVYAQEQQGGGKRQFNPDRLAKIANARIAAVKAGLELTPDQAQKWGPYQQALQDMLQFRVQRLQARQAAQQGNDQPQKGVDPFANLSSRADAITQAAPLVKKMADTGEPLYQSLSDAQKGRFKMLTRLLLPRLTMMGPPGGRGGRGGGHRPG